MPSQGSTLQPSPGPTLQSSPSSFEASPAPFNPSPTNTNDLGEDDFTAPPPSGTGGSSFYDSAYRDVNGLKPPTVYNPYEGAYQSFLGSLSSTPTFAPSPQTPSLTFEPPKLYPASSPPPPPPPPPVTFSTTAAPPYPPGGFPNPALGPAASFAPPFGWQFGPKYPAQVINVDLFLPGRALSPGDALRRETGEALTNAAITNAVVTQLPGPTPAPSEIRASVTNCQRHNNEFNCSVKKPRGDESQQPFKHSKRNIVVEKRKLQEAQRQQQSA